MKCICSKWQKLLKKMVSLIAMLVMRLRLETDRINVGIELFWMWASLQPLFCYETDSIVYMIMLIDSSNCLITKRWA